MHLLDKPGLGIEIDEDKVRAMAAKGYATPSQHLYPHRPRFVPTSLCCGEVACPCAMRLPGLL